MENRSAEISSAYTWERKLDVKECQAEGRMVNNFSVFGPTEPHSVKDTDNSDNS